MGRAERECVRAESCSLGVGEGKGDVDVERLNVMSAMTAIIVFVGE